MTFAQKNGRKKGTIGSSIIRGEWLIDKWKDAEIFTEGKKFDVIIFQKVYWNDYAKDYKGIKILDLCVSSDSLIFTKGGWKYAEEVKIGDMLLTHKGRFQRVNNIFKKKDHLRTLKSSGLYKIRLTDNHPIWTTKSKYSSNTGAIIDDNFKFVPVSDLETFKRHKGGNYAVSINSREIEINNISEDLAWFYGYYCAEGSGNKNGVSFAMHVNERAQRENILRIIKKEFGKNGRYYKNGNSGTVAFNSRKLRRFLKENCKSRENKNMPSEMLNAPIKSKLAFIEGYLAGDGYCNDYGGISVSTISKKLAYSVWQLLKDCGITAGLNYHKREGEKYKFIDKRNGKEYYGRPQWRIQLNPKESIKFYNVSNISHYKKCRIDYWKTLSSKNTEITEKDIYHLHPIREIGKKDENKSVVYNFNVGTDHSYVTDGVVVKNCDPDWLSSDLEFKKLEQNIDAITCASKEIYRFIKQIASKPVYYVPDRVNLDIINRQKEHINLAKTIGWFGYHHNAKVVLPQVLRSISKLGLKLIVVSNGDYKPKQGMNIEVENRPFIWDTFVYDMMDCDVIMNPKPVKLKRFKYKSNNKTIISWAMGIPIANTLSDLQRFMKPEERKKEAEKRLQEVKEKYSIEQTIKQFKDIIKTCEEKKQ